MVASLSWKLKFHSWSSIKIANYYDLTLWPPAASNAPNLIAGDK